MRASMDPPPPPPSAATPWGATAPGAPPPAPASPGAPPRRPRSRWLWLAIGALCVALGGGLFAFGAWRNARTNAIPSSGVSFTDPTKHFSATYKFTPIEQDQNLTVAGRNITEVMWSDSIDLNTTEIAAYEDLPADVTIANPRLVLDDSVSGEVTYSHGSLLSKTFGTYQGFPSVDATVSAAGAYAQTRGVLADHTLYIVVVTSLHNPPELFADFARSIHLLHHAQGSSPAQSDRAG